MNNSPLPANDFGPLEYTFLSFVKSSLHRALLGEIIPSLRAIFISWKPGDEVARVPIYKSATIKAASKKAALFLLAVANSNWLLSIVYPIVPHEIDEQWDRRWLSGQSEIESVATRVYRNTPTARALDPPWRRRKRLCGVSRSPDSPWGAGACPDKSIAHLRSEVERGGLGRSPNSLFRTNVQTR